jgi:hypothetical protein
VESPECAQMRDADSNWQPRQRPTHKAAPQPSATSSSLRDLSNELRP